MPKQESKPAKELSVSRRDKKHTTRGSMKFEKRQASKGERALAKERISSRDRTDEEVTSHDFTYQKLREVVNNARARDQKRKLKSLANQKQKQNARKVNQAQGESDRDNREAERERSAKTGVVNQSRTRTRAERRRKAGFIRREQEV